MCIWEKELEEEIKLSSSNWRHANLGGAFGVSKGKEKGVPSLDGHRVSSVKGIGKKNNSICVIIILVSEIFPWILLIGDSMPIVIANPI